MTKAAGSEMDSHPKTIGRYRIESVLGRGAMGVIYRAYDPEIDRPVAIKLIRAVLLSGGDRDDYIQRFRREAQAAGRCIHPNIVTVYDFAVHEGNPFIAMEFVDGPSLTEAYRSGVKFSVTEAVSVILQVLDALAVAHRIGVIHRDIKPANILLVDDKRVKVTDFGISRLSSADSTNDGMVIGTPNYMSPEQCRGLEVDARSDLFSTGIVLYELLSGERPFAAPHPTAVMQRLLNDTPADIGAINPAVDPSLRAIVTRALAKTPGERYASATDMAAALRSALLTPAMPRDGADSTILMSRPPSGGRTGLKGASAPEPVAADGTGQFARDALATLERKLARHLGPIARLVIKNTLRPGDTVEAFCDQLAANIAQPEERNRFRAEAVAELQRAAATQKNVPATQRTATPAAMAAIISPAELQRAEKELTRYLGPIARVLVKRKAAEARSVAELWQLLAKDIEREDERRNFLRQHDASSSQA